MNLRHFNLNLLLVFEAMMAERNTTKAGQALGLSQSAVSSALAHLRRSLDDDLFVRRRNEMIPTARAKELAGPIGQALLQVRSVTEAPARFDPKACSRTFRIGMNDYGAFVLLGEIVNRIRQQSDNVRISVRNISANDAHATIDNDDADLCIAFTETADGQHETDVLFRDDWVCARRAGRKATLTLDEYLAANHVVVGNTLSNHVDRLLKSMGASRTNLVSVPFCLAAPLLVEQSDLLLTLPRRLACEFGRGRDIEIRDLPFPTRGFPVSMIWHARSARDAGLTWLRGVIASATVVEPIRHVA